jgi:hypothetical protein
MARRVLAVALILALSTSSVAAFAADVPISEDARSHFTAGVSFLQDPDGARYEEALREFQAAYAISPSWKILGNLGLAAMKLERDGEARDAMKGYLEGGGKQLDPQERAQMERDLQALEASLVSVHLEAAPSGITLLDERQPLTGSAIVNRYGPLTGAVDLGVRAGHHRFTAKLEGYADQVWEVEGQPRGKLSHSFALTPIQASPAPAAAAGAAPSPPPAPAQVDLTSRPTTGNGLRTASYVALGVGVVGLAAGTVFAFSAKNHYDDGNKLCPSFPCELSQADYDRRNQAGSDGDKAKTFSIVGFAVGGVGLAAFTTLFVLSRHKPSDSAPETTAYVGPGSVGVRGSF